MRNKSMPIFYKSILTLMLICLIGCGNENELKISVKDYQEKVYASWLAQIIGNLYGLPHENAHIDEPGPENFPYGYPDYMLEYMKEVNGAFSDDDTDFEYIYLMTMEEKGIEPTYADITERWLYHVRERVWLANRAALAFMHYGYTPPVTGFKDINPHWFQIDPQLVNEIWAVTAPGMISYAADKSAWAARITNDDWGIEPTIHYGAMYSAAFFESDVEKLIDIGIKALPADSRFIATINDMKLLYNKYPDDWQKARAGMYDKYYRDEPIETKTIWNANLNGAAGILALLYGQGDFQKTLDLSCAMGFDADNQAATMSGLLGIINGLDGLPIELLNPVSDAGWELPFNDSYKNVTRFDLPDASLKDMALRMSNIGEGIILKNGGKRVLKDGSEYYYINPDVIFNPPLEIPVAPLPYMEVGKEVNYTFYSTATKTQPEWKIVSGSLPNGIQFMSGKLSGTPMEPGVYPVKINVARGNTNLSRDINLIVRGENLASDATEIIASINNTDTAKRDSMWLTVAHSIYTDNISTIRDEKKLGDGSTFYSIGNKSDELVDYYGYKWDEPIEIGLINLNMGSMEENGGWFTSLDVEYEDNNGYWKTVEDLVMTPELLPGDSRFNKAHFVEYVMTFKSVKTRAIRIIGKAGGVEHWYSKLTHFTSVTELSVHGPLPGLDILKD
ncbi:MAG: ADP-ribosylglycohydrolase family protein [Candidatus Neomarinimicrobiota bacterium]